MFNNAIEPPIKKVLSNKVTVLIGRRILAKSKRPLVKIKSGRIPKILFNHGAITAQIEKQNSGIVTNRAVTVLFTFSVF